jgi:ubiquinol-cytochrome c reductase cytochrome b subunit
MAIAFYMVLTLSAMNDVLAFKFHGSLNATTWIGRIGMIVLPPFVYFVAYGAGPSAVTSRSPHWV